MCQSRSTSSKTQTPVQAGTFPLSPGVAKAAASSFLLRLPSCASFLPQDARHVTATLPRLCTPSQSTQKCLFPPAAIAKAPTHIVHAHKRDTPTRKRDTALCKLDTLPCMRGGQRSVSAAQFKEAHGLGVGDLCSRTLCLSNHLRNFSFNRAVSSQREHLKAHGIK